MVTLKHKCSMLSECLEDQKGIVLIYNLEGQGKTFELDHNIEYEFNRQRWDLEHVEYSSDKGRCKQSSSKKSVQWKVICYKYYIGVLNRKNRKMIEDNKYLLNVPIWKVFNVSLQIVLWLIRKRKFYQGEGNGCW